MHEQRMRDEGVGMDARVVRALERRPEVEVPVGFAARVAACVPARQAVALSPARYGRMAMRICMAVLIVAMVVAAIALRERTVFGVALEWLLCAQLTGLALWQDGMWRLSASEE